MTAPEPPRHPGSHTRRASSRVATLRHLLTPHQIRESLTLAPQQWMRIGLLAGLQAALTTLIALPLIYISPWPHLIGFGSLGTLVALFGRFAPQARRSAVVVQCAVWQTFAVLAMSTAVWLGAPPVLQLILLALSCGMFFIISTIGRFGPPGPLIFVFAASASMGHVGSFHQVMERGVATGLVALLAWLICASTEVLRRKASAGTEMPMEPVRPTAHHLIAAGRVIVATAIAGLAAQAAGAAYPGWAAMGALAVMQGTHLHISMNRALQRMAGTVIGALLVWLILSLAPSAWTIIIVLLFLVVATETIIGANYGLAQILITPMALLMTYLASPNTAGLNMVPERILDTLVGASIGMILALLCSTLDDRIHLAKHHAARAK